MLSGTKHEARTRRQRWTSLGLAGPLHRESDSAPAGFYDCLCVALAEREGCEPVTGDDRLVQNLQAQFPFIVPLAAL